MLLFALTRAALLLLALALGLFGGLLLPALAFLARLAAAPLFLGLALLGLTLARLALGGFHLAPAAFLARFLLALLFLRAPLSRFLVALPAAAALGLLGGAALLGLVTPALLRRHAARIGLGDSVRVVGGRLRRCRRRSDERAERIVRRIGDDRHREHAGGYRDP